MPNLTYKLLLRPTGGFWLFLSDLTMYDVVMDAAEMRELAQMLLEHADQVEKIPLGVPHTSMSELPKCQ